MTAFKRLLRAAPLPLLTGSLAWAISAALAWLALRSGHFGPLPMAGFALSAGWAGLALCCKADAFARFREYQRIKALFRRRGYDPRVLKLVAGSRCQRDAASLAATEIGHGRRARSYFRALGYRWYHLLPDKVADNPLVFFRPRFLRTTFLPGRRVRA